MAGRVNEILRLRAQNDNVVGCAQPDNSPVTDYSRRQVTGSDRHVPDDQRRLNGVQGFHDDDKHDVPR